jgi:hypothetical protein
MSERANDLLLTEAALTARVIRATIAEQQTAYAFTRTADLIDALAVRVETLETALAWYAERRNYRPPAGGDYDTPLGGYAEVADSFDGEGAGARARAALAGLSVGPADEMSSAVNAPSSLLPRLPEQEGT